MTADRRSLPVFPKGSIRKDGSREYVHPADVKGRFTTRRNIVFAVLAVIYVGLPWVEVGGRPAVQLNIEARQFYLFGAVFNAQDVWMSFFLLTGTGFALIFMTTLFGRVWCGYACPQTVFLEGLFRRIERWVEGPGPMRQRRNAGPLSWDKAWRKAVKHGLFLVAAAAVAHVFISYFVSLPGLFAMMTQAPSEHPEAFAWTFGITAVIYFNFSWFREQLCLVVCPYGRLQSLMTDHDTLVIGYDTERGEPRGKPRDPDTGDCVDCGRCVAVCPTGIDIRNGLQLECVGCSACVDACDAIMAKLNRAPGLVRYDSLAGLAGEPRKLWRPRLLLYGVLGLIGLTVASVSISGRDRFEANLLRQRGAPFVVDGDQVRNALELHVVNKRADTTDFEISVEAGPDATFILPVQKLHLEPLKDARVPLFVSRPADGAADAPPIQVRVEAVGTELAPTEVSVPFVAPGGRR